MSIIKYNKCEWDGLWSIKWMRREWRSEWDRFLYMKWMRWKWLGKFVASLSSIWKIRNSFTFFWVLQRPQILVFKTKKLLKSDQITFLQYITLSNKSYHIPSILCLFFTIIDYKSRNWKQIVSYNLYCFDFLTICPDFFNVNVFECWFIKLIVIHWLQMSRSVADWFGIVIIMLDVKSFGSLYQVTTISG